MTKKDKINYRFSGYNLPMLELDETGYAYYYIPGVHPYYTSQPIYWQQEAFDSHGATIGNRGNSSVAHDSSSLPPTPSIARSKPSSVNKLCSML